MTASSWPVLIMSQCRVPRGLCISLKTSCRCPGSNWMGPNWGEKLEKLLMFFMISSARLREWRYCNCSPVLISLHVWFMWMWPVVIWWTPLFIYRAGLHCLHSWSLWLIITGIIWYRAALISSVPSVCEPSLFLGRLGSQLFMVLSGCRSPCCYFSTNGSR